MKGTNWPRLYVGSSPYVCLVTKNFVTINTLLAADTFSDLGHNKEKQEIKNQPYKISSEEISLFLLLSHSSFPLDPLDAPMINH